MHPLPDPAREDGNTNASLSQPDMAAYLHAQPAGYHEPDSQPLYPSGPTNPPPPTFFPLLYPNSTEHRQRGGVFAASWVGALVALVTTLVLLGVIGIIIARTGLLHFTSPMVGGVTTIINSSNTPGPGHTPTAGNTPLPGGATAVPSTPNPQTTVTPQTTPGATPTAAATATTVPTATTAPLSVTIGCWASPDPKSAQFCVQTGANADLRISAVDCDGVNDTRIPANATADSSGYYLASWSPRKPGHGCHTVTITVTSTVGSQEATASGQFTLGN